MNTITIFTDGSSRGNPGPGGYGAIAIYPDATDTMKIDEIGGSEAHTTNNRMELMSAIAALTHFDGYYGSFEDKQFTIFSDSAYVINGITSWVIGWQKNNWINSQKKAVLNRDLWEMLIKATERKNITWKHVKGHAGHAANERCDEIATTFADGEPTVLFKGKISDYPNKEIMALVS